MQLPCSFAGRLALFFVFQDTAPFVMVETETSPGREWILSGKKGMVNPTKFRKHFS